MSLYSYYYRHALAILAGKLKYKTKFVYLLSGVSVDTWIRRLNLLLWLLLRNHWWGFRRHVSPPEHKQK